MDILDTEDSNYDIACGESAVGRGGGGGEREIGQNNLKDTNTKIISAKLVPFEEYVQTHISFNTCMKPQNYLTVIYKLFCFYFVFCPSMYNVALDQSRDISGQYFIPAGFEHILRNNDCINLSLQYAPMRNQNAQCVFIPTTSHISCRRHTDLQYNKYLN